MSEVEWYSRCCQKQCNAWKKNRITIIPLDEHMRDLEAVTRTMRSNANDGNSWMYHRLEDFIAMFNEVREGKKIKVNYFMDLAAQLYADWLNF